MRFRLARVASFARFTESFELPIERQGLVLIEGENRDGGEALDSNGAGKSALVEGVFSWNPFGKMPRYGDERIGASEVCYDDHDANIESEIETSRGLFKILRVRRPNNRQTFDIRVWDEQQCRWEPLTGTQVDPSLYVDDVSNLLGFNYTTLRHALFLQGSGLGVAKAAYSAQMRVLQSVLRFDVFDRAKKLNATDFSQASSTTQADIDEIDRLTQQAATTRGSIEEIEALDESARLHELNGMISGLDATIRTRDVVEQRQRERASAVKQADEAYREASETLAVHRAALSKLLALEGQSKCPTCDGKVHVTAKMLGAARRKVEVAQIAVDDAREAKNARADELDEVNETLLDVRNAVHERGQLVQERTALVTRQSQREDMLQRHRARLIEIETRIADLTLHVAVARRMLGIVREFRDRGIERLKARTLGSATPFLNDWARHYSDVFTDGGMLVQFDTQRVSRVEDIVRLEGASAPTYDGCSSGERRRIDLIIALSLRKLARWRLGNESVNVALWDEVFDTLDESGLQRAVRVLQDDMEEIETVFVITHHPTLKSLFPGARTLRVIREHGVSRVEYEAA